MWIIVADTETENLYRFYPVEQPQGDFGGVDCFRIYIHPIVRERMADSGLSELLAQTLRLYMDGSELPYHLGYCMVDMDYWTANATNTISIDLADALTGATA